MRSLTKSRRHFKRAAQRLPLGVTSNYRHWGPDRTLYMERASGARLWDVDGNEYIDYRLGYGPTILGYADPRVDEAARAGIEIGGVSALSTQRELVVADRIAHMVSAAEMVRFANSGTEAVMAALRVARAFTGKDGHIMVEGGFHGQFDGVLWQIDPRGIEDREEEPDTIPDGEGVPERLRRLVHQVPLNDVEWLEWVLEAYGDEIGAFLIEPIMGNACSITADPEYMKQARVLCDRHDVLMIIDEVKTGFRVARGGVQELMDVRADLCTFAKAMANGYPISALAGRAEVMRAIENGVVQGGTYAGHPVSLAAAEKTLEILDETDTLEQIASYGRRMQIEIGDLLSKRSVDHVFVGPPSMGGLFFAEKAPTNYRDWVESDTSFYAALAARLIDLGVLCEPDPREPWFISAAHDESCLSETLDKFELALDATLEERTRSEAAG